jgi:hypothetical protein
VCGWRWLCNPDADDSDTEYRDDYADSGVERDPDAHAHADDQ